MRCISGMNIIPGMHLFCAREIKGGDIMYSATDVIWVLIAAILVFFMQAGFALCEAGLTRAKNTGNILMKNMMDFCIGTPCYWIIGFGIMFAGSGPLIGGLDPLIQGSYDFGTLPTWCYAIFQTVFCATAATIVSGSMAERTNFKAYCIYSAAISLIVYPISGHWIWGGGWLSSLNFHDFAGSTCVHMVGGLIACLGAAMLGPRIGKYDKNGKARAIPGHNLTAMAPGLFYGGGFTQLGVQALGIVSVAAYVLIVMFIVFKVIDKTVGLRVPAQIEIDGLDMHEHGLASAYSGFAINDMTGMDMDVNENTDLGEADYEKASKAQVDAAVKVVNKKTIVDGVYDTGMHKVSIICRLSKFDALKTSLNKLGVTGITMTQVMGCGIQKGAGEKYRGVELDANLIPKVKVEVVVSKIPVDSVIEAAKKALYTGHIGDGKIFVYNVTKVVKVRTGEEDFAALQDVE